jgi:hypothetical protein
MFLYDSLEQWVSITGCNLRSHLDTCVKDACIYTHINIHRGGERESIRMNTGSPCMYNDVCIYLDADLEVGAEVLGHHLLEELSRPVDVEVAEPLEKEVSLHLARENDDPAEKFHYLVLVCLCV